jgi:hypothetical protein
MQADWEFELGDGAPIIDAAWSGFVDLRSAPVRAYKLPEVAALPSLAQALVRLNAAASPVWTSKCDFWSAESLAEVHFDVFDLDATEAQSAHVLACYIDLLPRGLQWSEPASAEQVCRKICTNLKCASTSCSRTDLVIRRAEIAPGESSLGITAYLIACGALEQHTLAALAAALHAFVGAVLNSPSPAATA